ncbi:MAG: hypothetical protein ACI8PZ_004446 [Myxococcota bacterium]|jgi:hypothetical protein
MRTFLIAVILTAAGPALAGKAAQSSTPETERLDQELGSLATKNAWAGVERVYTKLVELGEPPSVSAHLLGARAARDRGDMLAVLVRLRAASRAGAGHVVEPGTPIDEAMQALDDLESRFGRVRMRVSEPRTPVLIRPEAPFAPDERASINHARERLADGRYFRGLLPTGRYVLDGFAFEVAAGPNFQDITLE